MSAKKPDPFILFSDSALSELEHDAFDLEKKLGVIRSAILNPKTETPFTVMVTGGWGSGKTSAMAWLQKDLGARAKKAGDGEIKADTCWFYPWKYQNQEDVWRGLISEVILAISQARNLDANQDLQALLRFTAYLGRLILAPFAAATLKAGDPKSGALDLKVGDIASKVTEATNDFFDPEAAYLNDFERTLREWVLNHYLIDGDRRMVIFIDDLDRCQPDIALQVLEALKLYLNIPNLMFVVGVDTTVIKHIVAKSYCDMVGEKAMEEGFRDKAAKYLDKMFQVEINIEPTDHEIKTFFEEKVEKSTAWRTVPKEMQEILRILLIDNNQGISDLTPRTMVRQLNRLLVAAQRDSGEGSQTRAQAMQREMIDLICHEKGFGDNLPQRSQRGREFFRKWSEIIQENLADVQAGRQASYFPPDESQPEKEEFEKVQSEQEFIRQGFGVDVSAIPAKGTQPDLSHLASLRGKVYVKYRKLLFSAPLARLLELPYVVPEEDAISDLLIVKGWIAAKKGIQQDRISSDEIRALRELDIMGLEVSDLFPISRLTRLQKLNCDATQVSDLTPLSDLTFLRELSFRHTRVTDLSPLSGLNRLTRISFRNTGVTDLSPLSRLTLLRELSFRNTGVTDLSPLSHLLYLEELGCYNIKITDLSPLINLIKLRTLYCHDTLISDLTPLTGLTGLHTLSCSFTKISDLSPLYGLINLRELHCRDTLVPKEEVDKLKEALPDCRIFSDFG